jgi:hypothetical protein
MLFARPSASGCAATARRFVAAGAYFRFRHTPIFAVPPPFLLRWLIRRLRFHFTFSSSIAFDDAAISHRLLMSLPIRDTPLRFTFAFAARRGRAEMAFIIFIDY